MNIARKLLSFENKSMQIRERVAWPAMQIRICCIGIVNGDLSNFAQMHIDEIRPARVCIARVCDGALFKITEAGYLVGYNTYYFTQFQVLRAYFDAVNREHYAH